MKQGSGNKVTMKLWQTKWNDDEKLDEEMWIFSLIFILRIFTL